MKANRDLAETGTFAFEQYSKTLACAASPTRRADGSSLVRVTCRALHQSDHRGPFSVADHFACPVACRRRPEWSVTSQWGTLTNVVELAQPTFNVNPFPLTFRLVLAAMPVSETRLSNAALNKLLKLIVNCEKLMNFLTAGEKLMRFSQFTTRPTGSARCKIL